MRPAKVAVAREPVSLCIAGVLYLLVTGWLDHRAKAREAPDGGPTE